MNNGKVRIYELSKELNLENKDILAVCEQLNISVKSHSSTITDDEAERIRSTAEKVYASSPRPPVPPQASAHHSHAAPGPVRDASNQPIKKQQILEVRRLKPPVTPNPAAPAASAGAVNPPVAGTPQPPSASLSSPAPVRLATPNRPLRPGSNETVVAPGEAEGSPSAFSVEPANPVEGVEVIEASPVDASGQTDLPQEFDPVQDEASASKEGTPEEPSPAQLLSPSRPASQNQAQIAQPPARPVASPSATPRANLVNRPVLKQDRPASGSPTAPAPIRSGEKPERPERRSTAPAGRDADGTDRPRDDRPRERRPAAPGEAVPAITPRPQLIRPSALREASQEVGSVRGVKREAAPTADATGAIPEIATEETLLRRPTPPRLPKKGKGWEEEEEETSEASKTSKAGKAKRRTQPELDEDFEEDFSESGQDGAEPLVQVSLSLARPARPKNRPTQAKPTTPVTTAPRAKKSTSSRDRRDRREEAKPEKPEKITLTGSLTVQELASLLVVPETDLIRALFFKGIAANINQTLDVPTATMLAEELEVEVETAEKTSEAKKVTEMLDAADLEKLQRRPPVVTIMGHVDHGKTTLLDSIRKTKVAQGEAGGITQHIGAYHVDVEHDGQTQQVVFLDTPGHEAFTAMRARGTRVTDIAILVVAADDGVQPQTVEAISHAKAAEVPIIVAINKIDKEGAQADRVKQELTEYNLVSEEWGGETIMVPVSALKGENLDSLLEMILLVAEVEDLYANPDRPARGTVIEANLDKARGPVASLLVQNGTLRVGDIIVAGSALGKVRAMVDDRGKRVEAASPSFAVEVLGLRDVPAAGDEFEVFQDEREAQAIATGRLDQQRQSRLLQQAMSARRVTLNTLSAKAQEGDLKELNLILKADVQGSVEAILGALQQLPQNEVQVRVLLAAPGEVTETDVDLAAASAAVILGFNTTLASGARQAADQAGVDVREYNIIYKLLDDIQGAMEGLLEPELVEEALGQVEVRAVFPVGKGSVAGCYVLSGKAIRNCNVRIRRGSNVIHEGILDSLKRMKEDVKEVNAGYECGIGLSHFHTWEEGDIIEAFRMVTKRRTLSPA